MSLEDEKTKSNDITITDRTLDFLFDEIKLTKIQKFSLATCYIVLIVAIIGFLEITKHINNPDVPNVVSLDYQSLTQSLLLFVQLIFLIILGPFTIYDIIMNKFFKNLKKQIPLLLILAGLVVLSPAIILLLEVRILNPENQIVNLGVEPEVLFFALLVPFVLYYSIPFLIINTYKKNHSSLESN